MSNQGIRAYAREVFVNQNELRRRGDAFAGPKGNTEFRKTVMCAIMTQHGVTLASAATHYNDAFKFIKEQNAELVSGLGRPDDKKGGRKPKIIAAPAAEVTRDAVLANMLAAIPATVSDITESTLLAGAVPPGGASRVGRSSAARGGPDGGAPQHLLASTDGRRRGSGVLSNARGASPFSFGRNCLAMSLTTGQGSCETDNSLYLTTAVSCCIIAANATTASAT